MATRNFVPRADHEGGIGTEKKRWKEVRAGNFYGNLQGTINGQEIPENAVFTDTWRGIVNALNSTSTSDSLSAAQGKILNESKLDKTEVANTANKIPRYNAAGHLVLPSGAEIW